MQQIFDRVPEIFKKVFPAVSAQLIWKPCLLLPTEAVAFFFLPSKSRENMTFVSNQMKQVLQDWISTENTLSKQLS